MASGSRPRTGSPEPEPQTEGDRSVLRTVAQMIEEAIARLQNRTTEPTPPPPTPSPPVRVVQAEEGVAIAGATPAMIALKAFEKRDPPYFSGGSDPLESTKWLARLTQIFDTLEIQDGLRTLLATYYLLHEAYDWWVMAKGERTAQSYTWKEFSDLFLEKFFPRVVRDRLVREFLELTQKNMTVSQYEAKFNELSKFAGHLMPTEEDKARRFEWGLKPSIRTPVIATMLSTYREVVQRATMVEETLEDNQRIRDRNPRNKDQSQGDRSTKRPRFEASSSRGQSQYRQQQQPFRQQYRQHQAHSSGRFSQGQRTCFVCGQPGHFRRECPQLGVSENVARPQQFAPQGPRQLQNPQNPHTSSSAPMGPRSVPTQNRGPGRPAQQGQGTQGRVFALTNAEDIKDHSVVRGKAKLGESSKCPELS